MSTPSLEKGARHQASRDLQRCQRIAGLAAEATEETALLLGGRVLLVGMVLIAPLIRGHLLLHRVDVLAAALPGGLSAYLAGGGSTHVILLPLLCFESVGESAPWCYEFSPVGWLRRRIRPAGGTTVRALRASRSRFWPEILPLRAPEHHRFRGPSPRSCTGT